MERLTTYSIKPLAPADGGQDGSAHTLSAHRLWTTSKNAGPVHAAKSHWQEEFFYPKSAGFAASMPQSEAAPGSETYAQGERGSQGLTGAPRAAIASVDASSGLT